MSKHEVLGSIRRFAVIEASNLAIRSADADLDDLKTYLLACDCGLIRMVAHELDGALTRGNDNSLHGLPPWQIDRSSSLSARICIFR